MIKLSMFYCLKRTETNIWLQSTKYVSSFIIGFVKERDKASKELSFSLTYKPVDHQL